MMTTSNNQQQEIRQLLQTEFECVQLLLKSLEMEYDALANHHAAALEEVVRGKQERIQQLEMITKKREKLLATSDSVTVDDNEDQHKHYYFKDNKQLTELWNQLVDVAEQCRDKNRVNGSIVELVSRQSRHALDILHGIVPDASSMSELYDNAGQTKTFSNKRSLVHV